MGDSSSEIWESMIGQPSMGAKAQGAVSWGGSIENKPSSLLGPRPPHTTKVWSKLPVGYWQDRDLGHDWGSAPIAL
ncbi:hypothetical protein L218DRAFT_956995, partial [Marasmius fiardii PR-910]